MNRSISVLVTVLMTTALPAQGDVVKPVPQLEKLAAEWKAAMDGYREAMSDLRQTEAYKAARRDKDNVALRAIFAKVERPDAASFGQRALKLADHHAGEEELAVLTFAATNLNDSDVFESLVTRIESDHVKSAGLVDVIKRAMVMSRYVGAERTAPLLDRIAAENQHALPRAWAMYYRSFLIKRDKNATEEDIARAADLLAQAEKLAEGTALADKIAGPRYEKEHLQIGMVAPNIVGADTDGVAFELEDYRGKVVVLDFWGFW